MDDSELIARMLAGEEEAFIALYRRRQAALHRFALRMAGSTAAAEDAVQETFLILIRQAAQYEPARGSVSAFLYGITRNCVRRGLERSGACAVVSEQEIKELPAQSSAWSVGATATTAESLEDRLTMEREIVVLRQTILTLPEHYRAPLVLCDLEELSYEETAAALGCAVGTVRSRLHRARALLAQRMRRRRSGPAIDIREGQSELEAAGKRRIKPMECEA